PTNTRQPTLYSCGVIYFCLLTVPVLSSFCPGDIHIRLAIPYFWKYPPITQSSFCQGLLRCDRSQILCSNGFDTDGYIQQCDRCHF
ncbi:MAG: hypothetical protein ACKPKS_13770, partial [Dolichospermum sp.]